MERPEAIRIFVDNLGTVGELCVRIQKVALTMVPAPRLRLDHVGFVVADLDAAVAWYTEALGSKVEWLEDWTDVNPGKMALAETPAVRLRGAVICVGENTFIELHEFAAPASGESTRQTSDRGIGHVSFYTPDIKAEYARLGGLGVHWYGEPTEITDGGLEGHWWCYGRDPFGMLIQLNWWPESSRRTRHTQ